MSSGVLVAQGVAAREGVSHVPGLKDPAAWQGPFACLHEAGVVHLRALSGRRLVVA